MLDWSLVTDTFWCGTYLGLVELPAVFVVSGEDFLFLVCLAFQLQTPVLPAPTPTVKQNKIVLVVSVTVPVISVMSQTALPMFL